jgi:hypothetical protein
MDCKDCQAFVEKAIKLMKSAGEKYDEIKSLWPEYYRLDREMKDELAKKNPDLTVVMGIGKKLKESHDTQNRLEDEWREENGFKFESPGGSICDNLSRDIGALYLGHRHDFSKYS